MRNPSHQAAAGVREKAGHRVGKTRKAPRAAVEEFEVVGIPVRLTRKRVRRLNLRISRDGTYVEMSAPPRIGLAQIEGFVLDKQSWIRAHMAEAVSSPAGQAEHATAQEVSEWKTAVSTVVPPLIKEWEPIIGVHQHAPCPLPARMSGVRGGARAVPSAGGEPRAGVPRAFGRLHARLEEPPREAALSFAGAASRWGGR